MIMIPVSRLRENLVSFLKKVEAGEEIVITSYGRKIAKITSLEDEKKEDLNILKQLRKTAVIKDVMSPLKEKWKASK